MDLSIKHSIHAEKDLRERMPAFPTRSLLRVFQVGPASLCAGQG